MEYECMICTESDDKYPLYKPCNCNTLIHKDCLTKLVDINSHQHKCAICLKEYNFVIISKNYKFNFDSKELLIFGLIYLSSIMLIILSLILIFEYKSKSEYIIPIVICGSFFSCGMIISIHLLYFKRTRKFCCINRQVKLIRQIILPSPYNRNNIV